MLKKICKITAIFPAITTAPDMSAASTIINHDVAVHWTQGMDKDSLYDTAVHSFVNIGMLRLKTGHYVNTKTASYVFVTEDDQVEIGNTDLTN